MINNTISFSISIVRYFDSFQLFCISINRLITTHTKCPICAQYCSISMQR